MRELVMKHQRARYPQTPQGPSRRPRILRQQVTPLSLCQGCRRSCRGLRLLAPPRKSNSASSGSSGSTRPAAPGYRYGQFMHGLTKAGIQLNRKVISELAIHEPDSFKELAGRQKPQSRPKGPFFFRRGEGSPSHCRPSGASLQSIASRADWEQAKASVLEPSSRGRPE